MSKILFVKPRETSKQNLKLAVPPLGIAYLSSSLKNRRGDQIDFIDMHLDPDIETVIQKIEASTPDYICISTMTSEFKMACLLAKIVKEKGFDARVIIGGPHVTAAPEEVVSNTDFDYAVLNEGEQTLPELLDGIESGADLSNLKGIGFLRNKSPEFTQKRDVTENIDTLPFPDWDVFDLERYYERSRHNPLMAHTRFMPIFTSRGCPYNCSYCHNIFGKRARLRSPASVFEEILTLYRKHAIREFVVIDDVFNISPSRAEAICNLIIASGIKIHLSFHSGLRGDIMTDSLIKKLKQAGTYLICYAVETASPRLQKSINKNVNLEKLMATIEMTNRAGIMTVGFFMLGFPDESEEEMRMTIDYACKSKLNLASFFSVHPFPGTKLAQECKKSDHEIKMDPDSVDYFKANHNLSLLSDLQLTRIMKQANAKFLKNPCRTINTLSRIPSKGKLFSILAFYASQAIKGNSHRRSDRQNAPTAHTVQ
jgi:anaerobic magnesium-protoporphyrin IX monomethyl ester cyclase